MKKKKETSKKPETSKKKRKNDTKSKEPEAEIINDENEKCYMKIKFNDEEQIVLNEFTGHEEEEEEWELPHELTPEEDQEIMRQVSERIYSLVKWTKEELSWRKEKGCPKTLGEALNKRIQDSVTGCFISKWNFGKERDECHGLKTLLDLETREGRLNGWCENEGDLLKTLIHKTDPDYFSWNKLVGCVTVLRLCWLQITEMDCSLLAFCKLKALILTSNLLRHVPGMLLPRDIRFLELYNNCIEDLTFLACKPPPNLVYLGIGRNLLATSDSIKYLFSFCSLNYLDISDNNLTELPECLEMLKRIPFLSSLAMFGTPASMAVSYRRMVKKELPNLLILDHVDFGELAAIENVKEKHGKGNSRKTSSKKEKKKKEVTPAEDVYDLTGELQVHCFKVFGVKEPKKEKNIKHLYYYEIESPLLDSGLRDFVKQQILDEQEAERRRLLGIDEVNNEFQDGKTSTPNKKIERKGSKSRQGKDKRDKSGKAGRDGKHGSKEKKGRDGSKDKNYRGKSKERSEKYKSTDRSRSQKNNDYTGERGKSRSRSRKKNDYTRERGRSRSAGKEIHESKSRQEKSKDGGSSIRPKKYLFPESKRCSERHRFGPVQGWTQVSHKRCFLFKPKFTKWVSDSALSLGSRATASIVSERRARSEPPNGNIDDVNIVKGLKDKSLKDKSIATSGKSKTNKGRSKSTEGSRKIGENKKGKARGKSRSVTAKSGTAGAKSGTAGAKSGTAGKKRDNALGKSKHRLSETYTSAKIGTDTEAQTTAETMKDGKKSGLTGEKVLTKKELLALAKQEKQKMMDKWNSLLARDAEIEGSTKYRTNLVEWSRILEFKDPIKVATDDMLALRDTFRTVMTGRLVHLKVKQKKQEKTKKEKHKKDLKDQYPDEEDIILKEKLAVVPKPLEAIKWNQHYLGYTWDIKNPCLAEKYPNVKDIKFASNKGRKTGKKGLGTTPLQEEPDLLTVHVGVGVKRDTYE